MGTLNYNYEFLGRWVKSTGIQFKEVMAAVENSSSNNLHDWMGDGPAQKKMAANGEEVKPVPMNVLSMIKFCNYFGVPLESFFYEDDAPAAFHIPIRIGKPRPTKAAPQPAAEPSTELSHELDLLRMENKFLKKSEEQNARYIKVLERDNERLRQEAEQKKKGWTPLPDTGKPYPQIEMPLDMAAEDIGDSNPDK